MKAVVLVGGEGTRMRPLTETTPKPLIPFMNRPFLHHVLDHLNAHGVEEAVLSSPHLEREFRGSLKDRTAGPRITWVSEVIPLGTAGAVAGARRHLRETFLVLNGDVLTDLDLTSIVATHAERGAVATIALTRVADARPFGLVEKDQDGRVLAFREKPTERASGAVNAGTYVLEPRALDGVPADRATSIERETFPRLIEAGEPVYAMVGEGYWRDLGTPEAYLAAHRDALEGRIGGPYERPMIDPSAKVASSADLGDLTVVGEGARVGPGARVHSSVLHPLAVVEQDASVEGSILGPGAMVGRGARLTGCVLGREVRVEAGADLSGKRLPDGPAEG